MELGTSYKKKLFWICPNVGVDLSIGNGEGGDWDAGPFRIGRSERLSCNASDLRESLFSIGPTPHFLEPSPKYLTTRTLDLAQLQKSPDFQIFFSELCCWGGKSLQPTLVVGLFKLKPLSRWRCLLSYQSWIKIVQVAKDYSQPEVRRQQDEDKRLRLQVKSLRL